MNQLNTQRLLSGLILLGLTWIANTSLAQTREERKQLYDANAAYRKGDFARADSLYAASSSSASPKTKAIAEYNLGHSAYRQQKLDEAIEYFRSAEQNTEDPLEKAEALYNLGNAYYLKDKAREAYEAYKEALRLNPKDEDARHNLMMAKARLTDLEEDPEGDQQGDGDNNDGDQNENPNDGDQKNDQNGDGDQKQDGEGDQDQEGDKNQNDQGQPDDKPRDEQGQKAAQPGQISKSDAERMLDALNQRERQLMQDLMKKKEDGKSRKVEKDW